MILRGTFLGAAAMSAALALLTACTGSQADAGAGSSHARTPADLVVRTAPLEPRFLVTGDLEAVRSESIVVPRTNVWQLRIRWMEADGAQVQAGQKVLEFDNSAFAGTLEERRLAVTRAENDLAERTASVEAELADKLYAVEERRIALEKARLDAAIPEELVERRKHQEAKLALERATAEHEKATEDLASFRESSAADLEVRRIELAKARREVIVAERAIGELVLRAPTTGILVVAEHPWEGRKIQIGDTVWVGMSVLRIPDLSEMRVVARLSDVDDGKVRVGTPVRCTLDTYPDRELTGKVIEITDIAQESEFRSMRRSFRATIALDRSDAERMRPGMSVKVEVRPPVGAAALLAPRAGLDLASSPPRARLASGEDVAVRLGACSAQECVVESGLRAGQRLRSAS